MRLDSEDELIRKALNSHQAVGRRKEVALQIFFAIYATAVGRFKENPAMIKIIKKHTGFGR